MGHFINLQDMRDHWASHMAEFAWESDYRLWTWWERKVYYPWAAFKTMFAQRWAATVCDWRGHRFDEVEEFVACERDEHGRITDIDGGGVDCYCTRCGYSVRNWF